LRCLRGSEHKAVHLQELVTKMSLTPHYNDWLRAARIMKQVRVYDHIQFHLRIKWKLISGNGLFLYGSADGAPEPVAVNYEVVIT